MHLIGETPNDFTLNTYDTASATTLSNSSGDVVLLSFIELNAGWDWIKSLRDIQDDPAIIGVSTDIQILAVFFYYPTGAVSFFDVLGKFSGDPAISETDINFPILLDNSWASSIAQEYRNGFLSGTDPIFADNPGSSTWSYLISKDHLITDKWNRNCTANSEPISFNRMVGSLPFDSVDYTLGTEYTTDRMLNLVADPTILSANPADGGNITSLPSTEIIYSKPVSNAAVQGNYALSGAGAAGLSIGGVSYTGADFVENFCTLSIGGSLVPGDVDIDLQAAITDTQGNAMVDSNIHYTSLDLIAPTIQSWTSAGVVANGGTVDIAFSENVINSTTLSNYQVNYSGGGTVSITNASYNGGTNAVTLTLTLAGTDGSTFTIDTLTGPSPISDGTNNLVNGSSVTYTTADMTNPTINGWTSSGVILNNQTVYVEFSESVNNSDLTNNYQVNYSGAGSVSISGISYNNGTRRATLTLSISGTDGSAFTIETITGPSPIGDGTNNLINGVSNTYATVDSLAPTINAWTPAGTIVNNGTVDLTFSEDVSNGDVSSNYQVNYAGAGSVTINGLSYNAGTRATTLTLSLSATDGSNFTISTLTGASPINDGVNNLINGSSPTYIAADTALPAIADWTNSGTILNNQTVFVEFSENVNNSDLTNNYQVNYSGAGSVSISGISYNNGTLRATLTMSISGTDGSAFSIETITGPSPINDGVNNLINGVSNTYTTADVIAPTISGWTPAGTIADSGTVELTFSEDVSNGDVISNFQVSYSGAGSVSISGLSYNAGTFTTTLTISIVNTDGSPFTITTLTGATPISDGTNNLVNGTSPTYMSVDSTAPFIQSWTPSGLILDTDTIDVVFSSAVFDADNSGNYQVNYTGTGTLSISGVSYNAGTLTATLTMSISGTDGSSFDINTLTGPTPINDGANNLTNGTSNTYLTLDSVAPTIDSWTGSGTITNGQTIEVTFSENVSNADLLSNYQVNYAGSGSLSISGIIYDGGSFTATLTISMTSTDGTTFTVETISGATPISDGDNNLVNGTSNTYTSPVDLLPKDGFLALDCSGSMNPLISVEVLDDLLNVVYSDATHNRLYYMQESAKAFIDAWDQNSGPNDQIGIVTFKSGATLDHSLIPLTANAATLKTEIDALTAGGCTAMGPALTFCLDQLNHTTSDLTRKRSAFVFTDGKQNRNPLLHDSVPGDVNSSMLIDNLSPADFPPGLNNLCNSYVDGGQANNAGSLPFLVHNSGDDPLGNGSQNYVPISSVAIGYPASWQDMLGNMAAKTDGVSFSENEILWPDLINYFDDYLVDIFKGNSLQVLKRCQGSLNSKQARKTESVVLSDSSLRLTVKLSWLGDQSLTFKLKKGGKTIRHFDSLAEENTHRIGTISFPHVELSKGLKDQIQPDWYASRETRHIALSATPVKMKIQEKEARVKATPEKEPFTHLSERIEIDERTYLPGGIWEIVVLPLDSDIKGSIPYHLTIFNDDKEIEYDFIYPKTPVKTGELVPFGVQVSKMTDPVYSAFKVSAVIHKPQTTAGAVIRKYDSQLRKLQGSDEKLSLADRYLHLSRIKAAVSELNRKTRETLVLNRVSNPKQRTGFPGLFKGNYDRLRVPGSYRVDFEFSGTGKNTGNFIKTASRTFSVVAKPDFKKTIFSKTHNAKEKTVTLDITPKDQYGNLLGPGHEKGIQVYLAQTLAQGVTDKLNGTYTVVLDAAKVDSIGKAEVHVYALVELLYSGTYDNLKSDSSAPACQWWNIFCWIGWLFKK